VSDIVSRFFEGERLGKSYCEYGAEWVAIIGAAAAVAGAGVGAYAASEQAATQRDVAKFNQDVAENEALARRYSAQVEAENKRTQYKRILAAQRSRIGASGVAGSEGSPLLVQLASEEQAELDLERIKYAGETGARMSESEGVLQGYYGRRARQAGYVGVGTSLLEGTSNVANIYGRSQARKTTTG
jgi:hypothetical protein